MSNPDSPLFDFASADPTDNTFYYVSPRLLQCAHTDGGSSVQFAPMVHVVPSGTYTNVTYCVGVSKDGDGLDTLIKTVSEGLRAQSQEMKTVWEDRGWPLIQQLRSLQEWAKTVRDTVETTRAAACDLGDRISFNDRKSFWTGSGSGFQNSVFTELLMPRNTDRYRLTETDFLLVAPPIRLWPAGLPHEMRSAPLWTRWPSCLVAYNGESRHHYGTVNSHSATLDLATTTALDLLPSSHIETNGAWTDLINKAQPFQALMALKSLCSKVRDDTREAASKLGLDMEHAYTPTSTATTSGTATVAAANTDSQSIQAPTSVGEDLIDFGDGTE
jgi:hypothetical protein